MGYPLPGQIYDHYKGGRYEVITLCTHTETNEKLVIYKSLHFGSVHARPVVQWFDEIPDRPGFVPTVRFRLVEN